ncbi:Regulator of nonsense transcripts 1 [Hypsizygus marmoreus]|uniref:Regulator of nonsense transcripts 1 n=1 Tax=Hypsizygus marmoreus TaxID=39966 RepID=A0A369J518_HYPMA|nr:Regulator of nonsense transcripts 1 [Hypsizygus marmoreus]
MSSRANASMLQSRNELLAGEQAEDEAVLKERLSSWRLARLKDKGYCLTSLSGYWLQANQFGRQVASFLLGPDLALPEHKFENGMQVLMSRIDRLCEVPIKGSVVSQIRISLAEQFDIEDREWRLDVGRSNIIYEQMRDAISYLHHDPQQLEEQTILQGTHLRDVLLWTFEPSAEPHTHNPLQAPDEVAYLPHGALEHEGKLAHGSCDFGVFKDDVRIQTWASGYAEVEPVMVEGDLVLDGLNPTQTRAMTTIIGQRISLVQGVRFSLLCHIQSSSYAFPATWNWQDETIIKAVKHLKVNTSKALSLNVPQFGLGPLRSPSSDPGLHINERGFDSLVEGLKNSGVKALRVSFGGSFRSSLLEHTLDPLSPLLIKLVKSEELVARIADLTEPFEGSRKYALQQAILRDVRRDADVICTTCITLACVALNVTDFPVVFLDEASMSTEPASLIPVMKGSRHVALIGDHKQLPLMITSRKAQAIGLGIGLFERLTEEGVVPSSMLDIQYRMYLMIRLIFPSY